MGENKHTLSDLYQMQSLSLDAKIRMTKQRIEAWYDHWDGEVYVSFSGGKDSTVLLDIVRNECGYDDVPAVFVDTGLEHPEIREFVKTFENVTWLKPKKNFKQVIEYYGYPFISKEVSETVYYAKLFQLYGKYPKKEKGEYVEVFSKQFNKSKYLFMLDAPFKFSNQCCNVMKKNPAKAYAKKNREKTYHSTNGKRIQSKNTKTV